MAGSRTIRGRKAIAEYLGASEHIVGLMADDPECPVTFADDDYVADAEHLLVWAIFSKEAAA